jgi:ABC-type Fe3+ transport system permease subunit
VRTGGTRNLPCENGEQVVLSIRPEDFQMSKDPSDGIRCTISDYIFLGLNTHFLGMLKKVDNSLLEASENLGCSGARRFFIIVIPLIVPILFAGGLLVFMRSLADFGTSMLIGEGYRTFPVTIFNEFISELGTDDGFAAAISIIAILSWVAMINELSTAILLYVDRTRTLTVEIHTQIMRGNYGI